MKNNSYTSIARINTLIAPNIYIEKNRTQIKYKLFYNCECGVDKKIALRKDYVDEYNQATAGTAVTDTAVGKIKFFDEEILLSRLLTPVDFMPVSQELYAYRKSNKV